MSRKRNKLEIIHELLSIIRDKNNSIRKTPLIRYSNLSSQSFNNYYKELLDKGLVIEFSGKKGKMLVSLTEKGFQFLQKYKTIKEFINEFEL
ncbi:hypothetical protein COX58_03370 [archaeon CG_4_10_14_0_2_um_filter_Archaea_38_6]|nr:MAG: hypothetical protein COS83_03185 [archaeon CG07_land_8_20_14_0_80_38_8]PIU88770.1 MAG: hypothetical protein COS64_02700 [archaeon CG06_land_8_20_14_3_00_37_11]PJA21792.1 MAG: hypothetical protein COX58_03370 [archaeon CG_4_10_14_0_2_um_filter_Archaea_38_6]